jgi:hypothetical protein
MKLGNVYKSVKHKGNMNKRADTSTIPIIIAIVVGITVLIFVVFGFTTGWGNFWEKIVGGRVSQSNLDTIMSSCQAACAQNDDAAYCQDSREVNFGEKIDLTATSVKFKNGTTEVALAEVEDLKKGVSKVSSTCYMLAERRGLFEIGGEEYRVEGINWPSLKVNFNVAKCPTITTCVPA